MYAFISPFKISRFAKINSNKCDKSYETCERLIVPSIVNPVLYSVFTDWYMCEYSIG